MNIILGTSNTLRYPQGGHLWVFLNWALGFLANGCRVWWLDVYDPQTPVETLERQLAALRQRLAPWGLADQIILSPASGSAIPIEGAGAPHVLEHADLLWDLRYDTPAELLKRARCTALLDIDPGMLQLSLARKQYNLHPHNHYFTIGQPVAGKSGSFPDLAIDWQFIPPAVSVEHWSVKPPAADAALSTVSHWYMDVWFVEQDGSYYRNDKREAFMPFLDLPRQVETPLELAIHLSGDEAERQRLVSKGWRVREAHDVALTPADFQRYVQNSLGEFACAKPSYVRHRTGWISDRTICYLASGKPCIIQDTGPTEALGDGSAGVLRFSDPQEAAQAIQRISRDYSFHCRAARELAERNFSATRLARRVLEHVMV